MTDASSAGPDAGGRCRERSRSRFAHGFSVASVATVDECHTALDEIAREIADIEHQIEVRRSDPTSGEDTRLWLARARTAAKHRRATREALYRRMGSLTRSSRRRGAGAGLLADFVEVCRDVLDPSLLERLWAEAVLRSRRGEDG